MTARLSGSRLVLGLYAMMIAFSGVTGLLFARVVEEPRPPALFFLVSLPPTGVGFAVYGAVTVAVALGVPLALIVVVSTRIDDANDAVKADDTVESNDA